MPNFDQFTTIKEYQEKTSWLPRLGKIRLGVKVHQGQKEFPREVDFFVLPERLKRALGDKPKEITITFPMSDRSKIFPYAYKYYGSSQGLKCIGNGETAMERQKDRTWLEGKTCKCERYGKGCSQRGHLQFMLPNIGMGGVFQVDTGSEISITGINNDLDYIQNLVGRITWIPLTLRRVPTETHAEGKKQTHYTLQLECVATMDEVGIMRSNPDRLFKRNEEGNIIPVQIDLNQHYELPPPADENPALDSGATIVIEPEEAKKPVPTQKDKKEPLKKGKETPLQKVKDVQPGREQAPAKLPPGTVVPLITVKEFKEFKALEKIAHINKVVEALKIPMPTPAPLEEHSDRELDDVYDFIYRNHVPKEVKK
jgi:hypothetical protein